MNIPIKKIKQKIQEVEDKGLILNKELMVEILDEVEKEEMDEMADDFMGEENVYPSDHYNQDPVKIMYKFDEQNHIHTLNDKPLMGTTTLIKEVMPPMLSWWASGMALENLGWTNPRKVNEKEGLQKAEQGLEQIKGMKSQEFYDFLQKCYRNHNEFKNKSGDWGTKVHEAVEKIVKNAIKTGKLPKTSKNSTIQEFLNWAQGKEFLYSEVHIYSEKLWIGGIIDIVYKEDGRYYLGDIKTSKNIYPNHYIQMGMYDEQQLENGYFDDKGKKVGEPLDISGYTVINLPKVGGSKIKTYYACEEMRKFSNNLVELYKRLNQIKEFLKNG